MNERIKQLALQATEYVDVPMPNEIYNLGEGVFRKISTFNQEKFAELLVRECASVMMNKVDTVYVQEKTIVKACSVVIKQHFGVSE
jgi:hypothetical protein